MNLKGARTQGHPHHDDYVMLVDVLEQKIKLKQMEEQEALEAKPRFTALVSELLVKLPPDELLADLAELPPDDTV